jgi:hypothetical protein
VTSLIIGGQTLSDEATLEITQGFKQAEGGRFLLRMADGALRVQRHWNKKRITVRCAGWLPPDIGAIDWDTDPLSITLIDLESLGDPVVYSTVCTREPEQDWDVRAPGGGAVTWSVEFEIK